ncbi:CASP-like protein At2g36330 [Striga asiatica]|uniref:CASP-like protein At2g36330 n=1 Tax=Striga asiatica TaxID=4170 RepID=A0A5A7PAL9_STRAF|nr:CASP-like protein At2g36330 [Striga asiatica]
MTRARASCWTARAFSMEACLGSSRNHRDPLPQLEISDGALDLREARRQENVNVGSAGDEAQRRENVDVGSAGVEAQRRENVWTPQINDFDASVNKSVNIDDDLAKFLTLKSERYGRPSLRLMSPIWIVKFGVVHHNFASRCHNFEIVNSVCSMGNPAAINITRLSIGVYSPIFAIVRVVYRHVANSLIPTLPIDNKINNNHHNSFSHPLLVSEMENKPPSAPDSTSLPPHTAAAPGSEEHIRLSPPLGSPDNSPEDSQSSPLHSKMDSGGHISMSPSTVGSPCNSPARSSLASDHSNINRIPENRNLYSPENKPPPPAALVKRDVFNEPMESRVVLEEPMAEMERAVLEQHKAAAKIDSGPTTVAGGGGGESGHRGYRPSLSILRGAKREKMVKKAALGFRIFGFLFCLVSFSVMAADRNQGWALDSFDRYREFRYCMSVNVIGFVYSAAQAFDMSYNLGTGNTFESRITQIIAYLLISASSSAAIRVEDWQSNWGKDKFPDLATASISMSFLAFVALAINSLISGYALCTSKSL